MNTPNTAILTYSLVGDALALGPHWLYDQAEIASKLGRISNYQAPLTTYHPGKGAGDLTHYGDQAMVLLRSLAAVGCFDLEDFAARWRSFWADPATHSYNDGATRGTLAKLVAGKPVDQAASGSSDMGGAGRIGPLFLLSWDRPEALIKAARAQTAFTHGDPAVVEAAEFFARVVLEVQQGVAIPAALRQTAKLPHWEKTAGWLAASEASSKGPSGDAEALRQLGLSCHVRDAFGGICHLLLRYPQDPTTALIENAMAGGDNAARGLLLGLVHGAAPEAAPVPQPWLDGLRAGEEIRSLAASLAPN
jgi:ADP-ribosylglycohydrolase